MFTWNYRVFTVKSECRDFKFMGIACIPVIPVILKSQHSYFHCNICREFFLQINFPPMKALNFTLKSECGDFKITGIAGIHAIPINLKSRRSDFPAESL